MDNPYLFALIIGIAFLIVVLFTPIISRFAEWWWDMLDGWLDKRDRRRNK